MLFLKYKHFFISFLKIAIKYIIFFILFTSFIQNFKTLDGKINITIEQDDYIIKDNKYFLNQNMIKKFNSYLKLCIKGELIEKKKYPLLITPKISVIIPIFNGGKYLRYSLRTIQNQKLKEIEIIIIDDCSTDDSLIYIERLMKEEPRIKLIKNYRNRKILYSKSIGALNSNGEFILELDQDDMFIREDIFDIIYQESKKYKLDLVQFRDFVKESIYFNRRTRINFGKLHWILPKKNEYMKEDELKKTIFKNNNNYLLWGLLINSKIYKKAIYAIWEFIINYQYIYNEDYISSTMIILLSHNYKYLNTFGILHLQHKNATSFNCYSKKEFHLSNILFLNYLYDYHVKKNPQDIQLIINYINLNKLYQIKASSLYPNFFEYNIRNIFYNNYLLSNDKKIILDIFNITKNEYIKYISFEYLMNYKEFFSILNFQNLIVNKSKICEKNMLFWINKKNAKKMNFNHISIINSYTTINIKKIIRKNNINQNDKAFSPKISIIIYCKELKFLNQTLFSIIEQKKFLHFEIIIIYDNLYKMCLSSNFKYNNIFIINNFSQKGIMYSYAVGTLVSKGQYIINCQSGYSFSKSDILMKLYNKANKKKIDVLEFNLLINKDDYIKEDSFQLYKCHHFNSSLNSDIIKYNKNYKEIDQNKELLINKLIRSEIYKEIINKYKLFKYKKKIYNYYDEILIYLLNKNNYVFEHINIFGIIKNINQVNSLKLNQIMINNKQKALDTIFYINFIFENSDDSYQDKKFVYEEYINRLSLVNNHFITKSNQSIKLFKKLIRCEYINEIDKRELEFFYASINN